MDKILGILWHYTPRGVPPMASSSLTGKKKLHNYKSYKSVKGLGYWILGDLNLGSAIRFTRIRFLTHKLRTDKGVAT